MHPLELSFNLTSHVRKNINGDKVDKGIVELLKNFGEREDSPRPNVPVT